MDKKELEGYEKAMKKFGKRSHYQIAHDAVLDEKANQIANKKIATMQKRLPMRALKLFKKSLLRQSSYMLADQIRARSSPR